MTRPNLQSEIRHHEDYCCYARRISVREHNRLSRSSGAVLVEWLQSLQVLPSLLLAPWLVPWLLVSVREPWLECGRIYAGYSHAKGRADRGIDCPLGIIRACSIII